MTKIEIGTEKRETENEREIETRTENGREIEIETEIDKETERGGVSVQDVVAMLDMADLIALEMDLEVVVLEVVSPIRVLVHVLVRSLDHPMDGIRPLTTAIGSILLLRRRHDLVPHPKRKTKTKKRIKKRTKKGRSKRVVRRKQRNNDLRIPKNR